MKNIMSGMDNLLMGCWSDNPETLKMVKVIAISVCYMPKLDSKTLFLKMPHPLVSEHREIKLGTSSKLLVTVWL